MEEEMQEEYDYKYSKHLKSSTTVIIILLLLVIALFFLKFTIYAIGILVMLWIIFLIIQSLKNR